MNSALLGIMRVMEDETVDDITKWRKFCFTQTVRLRATEFAHFQRGLEFEQHSHLLAKELAELTGNFNKLLEVKKKLEDSLQSVVDLEKQISNKFKHMKEAKDNDAMLTVKLERAPNVFLSILQGHQLTNIPDIEKLFATAAKKAGLLTAQLDRVKAKIDKLAKLLQTRRDEIRQSKIIHERLESEIESLQDQLKQVKIASFPSDILSISSQFENASEASKRLLTLEQEIAELQTKMSNIQLDNRPSEASVIEGLIEREKEAQEKLMQNLLEKYNTDELDLEIESANQELEELKAEAERVRSECSAKTKQITTESEAQISELTTKISENDETIKELRERIAELSSKVPLPVHSTKASIGTQTIYVKPTFF